MTFQNRCEPRPGRHAFHASAQLLDLLEAPAPGFYAAKAYADREANSQSGEKVEGDGHAVA